METRALLAFLISVAILIGYQVLFAPAPPPPQVPVAEQAPVDDATSPTTTPQSAVPPAVNEQPTAARLTPPPDETRVQVEADLYTATFASFGGRIESFRLHRYRQTPDADSPLLDMVVADGLRPLGVYWRRPDGTTGHDARLDYRLTATSETIEGPARATVTMEAEIPGGGRITKTVGLQGNSYVLVYSVAITGVPVRSIGVAWTRALPATDGGRFGGIEGPVAFVAGELHAHRARSLEQPVVHEGPTDWAGYADHYFLSAYYADAQRVLRTVGAAGTGLAEVVVWDDATDGRVDYNLFVGPKEIRLLSTLGHNLDEAVNLGRFAFVARPMLEALFFLHRFTGNYGWAIVILTVLVRVIFYPVNQKQISAMKAMQRIQPELKRIQEKYKDDRERLNKEMIELYRRHKVNPLSGCLPMLLQLPVFLGLYNALMQSIELRHAPFLGWITDLSAPDRLGGLALPFVSPPGIPVLTLLMGASMVVQQKMTPTTGDPMQQRMMMLLPVVFTVMFINFPSGLVLYWLTNNVLSIVQQQLMTRGKS